LSLLAFAVGIGVIPPIPLKSLRHYVDLEGYDGKMAARVLIPIRIVPCEYWVVARWVVIARPL
jgi:hypothetical protein